MRPGFAGGKATLAAIAFSVLTVAVHATPQAAPAAPPAKPSPAPAPAKPTFDVLAQKAAAARQAGKLDEAIALYRRALVVNPSWTEGQWTLATILYDLDDYAEARDSFRRVVAADPKNGMALALLGLCEFQLKNYDRALTNLDAATTAGVTNPEVASVVAYHTAILLNRLERYDAAASLLRTFALNGKDTQSVIEAFGLSVLRLPYLPSEAPVDKREMILMAGRAGFQMAKGRRSERARVAFEELASRFPTAPQVHYAFGTFLVSEEPDLAIEEFRRELKASPNHYLAMLQIAFEEMKRSNYAAALPLAQKAVDLAPSLMAARNALGRALLETGDVPRAIEELEVGVKLAPDSPQTQFALARAYARAGRTEDAARARAAFMKLEQADDKAFVKLERADPSPSGSPAGSSDAGGSGAERRLEDPPLEPSRP